MINISDDEYLGRFWPDCPDEVVHFIEEHVVPVARASSSPCATDTILHEACGVCAWYRTATQGGRNRFHCFVGRTVCVASGSVVERSPNGRPRRVRSKIGPHRTYTLLRPPAGRAPSD
jgi:hypothetical protein